MKHPLFLLALLSFAAFLAGCQSASIAVKEGVFGIAKRDQLVARVKDARESQNDAKKEFTTALEEFQALTGVSGGELESRYKKLKGQYDRCESSAKDVTDRIDRVQTVGEKLFSEWRGEVEQMHDPALKSANDQQLRSTRVQYDRLVGAMKQAESKMAPVLTAYHDRVLFLKGALNAQAVASLNSTLGQMQGDVDRLLAEMNASIAEADSFIQQMKN